MAVIVDSYGEGNRAGDTTLNKPHPSGVAAVSGRGQSFTGNGGNITSCKFYMKKFGSPGLLRARLYPHTGTFGSGGRPNDTGNRANVLDISDTVNASLIDTNLELVEFTGFAGYTLVNGTKYCIVFESEAGAWDASNYVFFSYDNTSPTHAGNAAYYSSSAWTATTSDYIFYVYGTAVYDLSITDAFTVDEAITWSWPLTITDAFTVADVPAAQVDWYPAITDAFTIADVPTTQCIFYNTVTDAFTVADAPSIFLTIGMAIAENLTLADVPSAQVDWYPSVADGFTIAESLVFIYEGGKLLVVVSLSNRTIDIDSISNRDLSVDELSNRTLELEAK